MTIARIRTVLTGVAGTPWYSNMYFHDDGGTSIAPEAHAAVAAWWEDMAGEIQDEVQYEVLGEVAQIDEATGDITGVQTVAPVIDGGLSANPPLAWATQTLMRWLTDTYVDGRRVRGRSFVPNANTSVTTDGRPSTAFVGAMTVYANTLIAASSTGAILCIWQRPRAASETLPARVGSAHTVTAASCWDQYSVLRSRRD